MSKVNASTANYDLFENIDKPADTTGSSVSDLPDVEDLNRMFDIYNRQYFGGKLPTVKVTYSRRMLVAGGYYPAKREIRISEKYHRVFPDEVYDTLKHEMIHIVHFKHNAAFKRVARRIGASVRANEHPTLRLPPRYIYICPCCFTEYPRRKRLRMASCGNCSKDGFDPRYKLILKRRLKRAAKS
jgi:predicted SprT family Zn-dependent metalloprotease